MERSEIVVPARVVVVLLVALFYPLACALGLFARLVRTEPVGDLGVVVVWYDLMGCEVKPPIAVRHLTLLRAARFGLLARGARRRSQPTLLPNLQPHSIRPFVRAVRASRLEIRLLRRHSQAKSVLRAPPQHGGARLPTLTPRKIAR